MKKLLFLTTLVLSSLTTSAQLNNDKLPDGVLAVEWRFNPFDYDSKPVNIAQFTGRLFLDNKSVIRLGVGVGLDRDKQEGSWNKDTRIEDPNNYTIAHMDSVKKSNIFTLKVSLGYEYHLANTGRLDFYVGAEGGYLGKFCSGDYTKQENISRITNVLGRVNESEVNYTDYDYRKRTPDNKVNEHGVFATIFTGVDFFVYKKLYLGAELGVTFNTGKRTNGNYTKQIIQQTTSGANVTKHITTNYSTETGITVTTDHVSNTTTNVPDYTREQKDTYTKIYLEPAIRLGWMF